jgi:hypothetical protein
MKKRAAILLFLSILVIPLRSEANTKDMFLDPLHSKETLTLTQAQRLKESEIQGIYLRLKYGYGGVGGGVTIKYKPYLLLKDGSVYKKLDSSPTELDVARSKQTEPNEWGTWKINSKTLSIQWNDGESDSWKENWFKAFAAQKGDTLNGDYKSSSSVGNTSLGGDAMVVAFDNISFLPNGQFNQNKGAGASTSGTVTSSENSAQGTYKLNNYSIEFNYEDGRVVRKLFYFYPDKDKKTDKTIGIGKSSFIRKKS